MVTRWQARAITATVVVGMAWATHAQDGAPGPPGAAPPAAAPPEAAPPAAAPAPAVAPPAAYAIDWPARRLWIGADAVALTVRAVDGAGEPRRDVEAEVQLRGVTPDRVALLHGQGTLTATITSPAVVVEG